MPEAMYQLIYCSHNTISEVGTNVAEEVRGIIASSRRNNAAAGVTGALLFTNIGFAQVLEGPRDAVEAIFERIQPDMRHSDVTVLSFLPAAQRSFPAWSMALAGEGEPTDADALRRLLPRSADVEVLTTAGGEVLRLLEQVARNDNDHISF